MSKCIIAQWHLLSECIIEAPSHLECSFHKSLSVLHPCAQLLLNTDHKQPHAYWGKGHHGSHPRLHTDLLPALFRSTGSSGIMSHIVATFSSLRPSSYSDFPCLVVLTPPWSLLSHLLHCGISTSPYLIYPFGNLPSSFESLRRPLHVGQSLPLPNTFSRSPQSWLCHCTITMYATESLPPSTLGTLVVLMDVLAALLTLPQHPLKHINPVTAQQTYLKASFKKLLALIFKWENPVVSASCFGCWDFLNVKGRLVHVQMLRGEALVPRGLAPSPWVCKAHISSLQVILDRLIHTWGSPASTEPEIWNVQKIPKENTCVCVCVCPCGNHLLKF